MDQIWDLTNYMKIVYHVCLSAGDCGLLCRVEEDYKHLINCIGLAAYNTGSLLLAYSVMSNHLHCCVRTEDVVAFIRKWRYSYTRYFNEKYKRKGRLGCEPYILELNGLYHILTAIAYVLRNPLHHGVSATPFGYRYSSVNAIFRKEFGREPAVLLPDKSRYMHLPDSTVIPDGFKMDLTGLLLPECIIDITDVEHLFSTARSYLYYMNRISGKKWEEEQLADGEGQLPVNLECIEKEVHLTDMRSMLANEFGRANYNAITDIGLCKLIDTECSLFYENRTIYELSEYERKKIAEKLARQFHLQMAQIRRCLAIAIV